MTAGVAPKVRPVAEVTIAALRGRVHELEALGNHQPGNL